METNRNTHNSETAFDMPPRMAGETSSRSEAGSAVSRKTATTSTALSVAQERLWFLSQINPEDTSANIARAVSIAGPLKRDVLHRSLQCMIHRHELLRTTFATTQLYAGVDSTPVQLVADAGSLLIEVVDISETPDEELKATAKRVAREQLARTFDLSLGPLIRATLIRLNHQSHVLLITAHRIVADEESLNILFRELWQVYAAGGDPAMAHLSPMPAQYAHFAARQLDNLGSEAAETAIDYWRQGLEGAPPAVELPGRRSSAARRTPAGATVSSVLDDRLVARLRAFARGEDVTLRTVLLSAFAILLSRYSSQRPIVIGLQIINRQQADERDLIGPVSNVLPLRLDLSPTALFVDLLHQVEELVLESEKRGFVPFEKLLQELNVERSLSRPPLVQVTFDFRTVEEEKGHVDALVIDGFELDFGVKNFEISLDVNAARDRLECHFRYDEDIYDASVIEGLAGHFHVLLNAVACTPRQAISALPLLSAAEREQVLVKWNTTGAAYEQGLCVQQLFEAQAERTPGATAVVDQQQHLTYTELEQRANQLAWRLRREGVGCESLVAVCLERSVDLVVALLGIWKAGGAYVPLDPSYPQPRLRYVLEDTHAEVVITQRQLAARLPAIGKQLWLDEEREQLAQESTARPARLNRPESLGYVIYTSGSTGRPKGVAIEQRSTVALLQWAQTVYGPEDLSGVLASTSVCFDLSVFELFLPLSVGGTVVLAEDALQLASGQWGVELSLINTVPSAMAELLRLECLPRSVRVVNLAGEPLAQTLVQQLYEQGGIERVYDLYGPTEDTTYSTYALRSGEQAATIGRPIANTQVYLLDGLLQPVPIGVAGELYLGGAGLARGYLNRPELTAEKFIPNPYGEAGTRLYKTGDLARYQADGQLQYLGRGDQQVKVRGYRIELGEIEAALREHPSVRDAVVVVHERRLVAYVVRSAQPATNGASLGSVLREFIISKLPEYMAPAFFLELEKLPLTSNGKIDRRALPAPEEVRVHLSKDHVAPRDKVEEQLARLWAKVLQLKTVGVTDNFFEIGGDSLLAARLFAQIHNRFGKNLPLSTLFVSPTVEQLATRLREGEAGASWSSLVPIQPHGSKPALFCVHAAGANVLIYRPMSRHLGDDQPVYALQAQGLDGREPYTRVEDMAAHYVKEIRAFQPDGPYYLLGASFGGLVIYEMAQQFLAQGQEVGFLGMLNTNCPVYSLGKKLACHLGHLKERGVREYARGFSQSLRRRLNKTEDGAPNVEVQSVVQDQQDEALVRTVAAILEAEQNYVPSRKRYPGKITFFWADDAPRDFEDNRQAWTKIAAGGCEIHVVPGTHTRMREEPHVQKLVEKLKPCLERARAFSV
jgi:amino acid adenylation domain-containing protein